MIKKRLHSLDSREYEHPLDREALDKLESIPGIKTLIKKIYKEFFEKSLFIDNFGSNVLITKDNCPRVYGLLIEASRVLDMKSVPPIFITRQSGLNGFTQGVEEPHIILTKKACDELDDKELLTLIGHELGHIKSGHILYRQIAELGSSLLDVISQVTLGLGGIPASAINLALMHWYRMSEFTADRAGLLASQDLDACISLELKLAGVPKNGNLDEFKASFIKQAESFKDYDLKGFNKAIKIVKTLDQTHPYGVLRTAQIMEWGKSDEYKQILDREHLNIITEVASDKTFCPNCGTKLINSSKFCGGCGTQIKN